MIVHDAERWVYLGIPKTASTALHRFFVETRGARAIAGQHDVQVPGTYRGWRVFATTMNPYRRAHSLWRMLASDARKEAAWARALPSDAVESFERFADAVLLEPALVEPVYQWTMCRWLEGVPKGIEVELIPAEDLRGGLRELGIVRGGPRVPVVNSKRKGLEEAFTPAIAEKVRRWAGADFEAFGYPLRLADWGRPPARVGAGLLSRWRGSRVRRVRGGSA
jgi:hypothetical protein